MSSQMPLIIKQLHGCMPYIPKMRLYLSRIYRAEDREEGTLLLLYTFIIMLKINLKLFLSVMSFIHALKWLSLELRNSVVCRQRSGGSIVCICV